MNVDKIRFNHLLRGEKRPEFRNNMTVATGGIKTYVAVSSNTGLVKIGRSSNYELRLRGLEAKSKDTMLVIAVFNDNRELQLHRRFDKKRIVGEWFSLTFEDLEQLRGEGHIQ